jgi:DNA-binding transcriptional LysR family regulator
MWWEDLSYLDELSRSGTMAATARVLRVDKATVSRRLSELERNAPAPLFERRAGQLSLTPYGTRALAAYREHVHARTRLEAQLRLEDDDARGSVHVNMPSFLAREVVGPALPRFIAAYPTVDVRLTSSNRLLDSVSGESDIALRTLRPRDGNWFVRKVGRLQMAMFASREYLARRGDLVAHRCLLGHELIVYDTGPYAGPGFEWMNQALPQARIVFSANDAALLCTAAVAGLGLVTLPAFMGDETDSLVRVAAAGEGATELWLVMSRHQRRVPRVHAVQEFLCELLRQQQERLNPTVRDAAEPQLGVAISG